MIDIKEVLSIHNILIDKFGGSKGIRDITLLESALYRPFSTFEEQDLYPSAAEKAAAILESILINHPFIDGNKRTAYVLMRLILLDSGFDLIEVEDEKYKMVISASNGDLKFNEIKNWIDARISLKNR